MPMQWNVQSNKLPKTAPEVTELLLKNRAVQDKNLFFNPPYPASFSPESVGIDRTHFLRAVKRLQQAGKAQEKVLIFGDYDADGICATAVLWKALHAIGCQAQPFIPNRFTHGYGLSLSALEEILSEFKPTIVVTVDNGIVAFPALKALQKMSIEVIVTDHHQPEINDSGETVLPPALAIVHTTQLCGTTVSWMLAHAVAPEVAAEQLDLCAIATVADMVPLTDANRSFASHGIIKLQQTTNLGLKELFKVANIKQTDISAQTVGYSIGPRINAMGRVAQGMDALRLLCATTLNMAKKQATLLQNTNVQRQELTSEMFEVAIKQAEEFIDERVIVVASELYHEGVIGLVAGRLVEKYHKPAIAIAYTADTAKASARSVMGVNIVELIRSIREDLLELGGHPMAAGFSLLPGKIELVKKRLQTRAKELVSDAHLEQTLAIECELPQELISEELLAELERFEPTGRDNEKPVFLIKNVSVLSTQLIGKAKEHLKIMLALESGSTHAALFWRGASHFTAVSAEKKINLVGVLEAQLWNGKTSIQLIVKDWEAYD
jgi:single-stranded-DNA-specific exonuclease